MVVQHGCQQVVGCANGVHVACKVEVDVLHGNDLGISAAGGTALQTEDRSEGWLPKCNDGVFPEFTECVTDAHRGGGLSLTGRGGVDGGDKNQFGRIALFRLVQQRVVDLGLVFSIVVKLVLGEPDG